MDHPVEHQTDCKGSMCAESIKQRSGLRRLTSVAIKFHSFKHTGVSQRPQSWTLNPPSNTSKQRTFVTSRAFTL